ncbi:MAG TPA: MerR family DNA-binding protein [Terracidiphilus sp.]|nr:MerR family DNA-binding protein [Terracidiphilus sp.]
MGAFLQIGDVVNATGLSADTIRFYERERLLPRAARSNGGFRMFSNSDVADLTFVRNAQELGFSLQEIRELMRLKNAQYPDCARLEKLLESKISSVRTKIAALRKLERELKKTMDRCQANLRKAEEGMAEDCPALSEISQGKGRKKK